MKFLLAVIMAAIAAAQTPGAVKRSDPVLVRAVIDGDKLVFDSPEHQPHVVARLPAREACDHVAGEHRLAVVERERGAQPEGPGEAVRRNFLRFDHLALWPQLVVNAVKHVPDQRGAIAHDILGVPDRVEIGEIGLRDEAQRARRCALGDGRRRQCACRNRASRRFQERSAMHGGLPQGCSA